MFVVFFVGLFRLFLMSFLTSLRTDSVVGCGKDESVTFMLLLSTSGRNLGHRLVDEGSRRDDRESDCRRPRRQCRHKLDLF